MKGGGTYVDWADGQWIVRGDFDSFEARTIARALERDGLAKEAREWFRTADDADRANGHES